MTAAECHHFSRPRPFPVLCIGLGFAILLAACKSFDAAVPTSQIDPASTLCDNRSANISVMDGLLQPTCGCQEGSTAVVVPPASLTCTVPVGTVVFFNYVETRLLHQIVPTNGQSFPASPLSDPENAATMLRSFPVTFDTAGSYGFEDAYNLAMHGTIVVL